WQRVLERKLDGKQLVRFLLLDSFGSLDRCNGFNHSFFLAFGWLGFVHSRHPESDSKLPFCSNGRLHQLAVNHWQLTIFDGESVHLSVVFKVGHLNCLLDGLVATLSHFSLSMPLE